MKQYQSSKTFPYNELPLLTIFSSYSICIFLFHNTLRRLRKRDVSSQYYLWTSFFTPVPYKAKQHCRIFQYWFLPPKSHYRQSSKYPLNHKQSKLVSSDLKDVFTNASGLSTGGSSSAKISSGGLGSLMMVGFGLSLRLPVSPPIMVFHKQFCDLDPAETEWEGKWTLRRVIQQSRKQRYLSLLSSSLCIIRFWDYAWKPEIKLKVH